NLIRALRRGAIFFCAMLCAMALPASLFAPHARAEKLALPPGTSATLDKIYSFDTDGAMTDARHRPKLVSDQHYLELAARASSIALAGLKNHESAQMQFYAGMGDAFA